MSMEVDMMKKNILKVASVATVLVMITVSCGGIIETEATGSNLGGEAMASVNSSTPTDFISDSSWPPVIPILTRLKLVLQTSTHQPL